MLRFGTDGVRGVAFTELTENYVAELGLVAAQQLGVNKVLVGRDTRESGPRLEAALAHGLLAGGVAVELLGVAPTPAIAFLAAQRGCASAAITASHNPYADNGVKLFANGGLKLSDAQQDAIESQMTGKSSIAPAQPTSVDLLDEYVAHIVGLFPALAFAKIKMVLDCAHGAMSTVAPQAFARLGATVIVMNDEPNGTNINDGCGATHPEVVSEAVRLHQADLGLAFDGDGDRVIAVDHVGDIVDGDHLLALAAIDMHKQGKLKSNAVAVTVMTNAGFHAAMKKNNITVVTTPVGDRNVLAAFDEHDIVLGGEQSGHIIYRDHATTGDGLLAGAMLVDLVRREGTPLATLARNAMTSLPQTLINVRVENIVSNPADALADEITQATARLQGVGRVLLRASGTEPVIRVMVEASFQEIADSIAQGLADVVSQRFGGVR
jgi:phosphoglucosamine mutase